jgi:hypothetical protein
MSEGVRQLMDALSGGSGLLLTPAPLVLLSVLMAFAGGLLLAWVYMLTHSGLSYSRSFVSSLVVIPVIVSLVMMVMANNIITAFGLMAVFAIVRFRNILRDTLDTAHILSVIVLGMAAGTQKYGLALVAATTTSSIMLFLWGTSFGKRRRYDCMLNFSWMKSMDQLAPALALLNRYGRGVHCAGQRSDVNGEGVNLSYRLLLRDPDRLEHLLEGLRSVDGLTRLVSVKADAEDEV